MSKTFVVFRNQLTLFFSDRGMLIFYFLAALLTGGSVPFFIRDMATCIYFAMLLTVTLLIPLLADSLAGEREKKTLESLLSTVIKGSSILWGKFLLSIVFALVFFILTTEIAIFTSLLTGAEIGFTGLHWIGIGLLAIMTFISVILSGLYQSALSGDTQSAYTMIAFRAFPLCILYMAGLTAITRIELHFAVYVMGLFLFIYVAVCLIYLVKIAKLRQATYFENVKYKKRGRKQKVRFHETMRKSPMRSVFAHEMRYLATLKLLLFNFLILCLAPASACILGYYYLGDLNLNYAVLLTALMMPRTPTNLIAYSIGGEKVYKTAESLLSTPLHVRSMFLAKMMVPVVVSSVMLLISSSLTLIAGNIVGHFMQQGTGYMYTTDQLILLFPVSILSCISMVLITGSLSARMKRPRNGLYISSVLGLLFVFPPLSIVYWTENHLLWSMIYCIILAVVNRICLEKIAKRISRPQLMNWI
ncbi:hypothetical protein NSA47_00615 [Irregularibacter muris]|uniref:ABC transporter permease n=1 Tax=Irregularibacter muris TaxID=1796619 RepID=A0AAE3HC89_9FIRM|nr:ABC transporter permease [Irregularibacter muris]MCR1897492.1 hypothetical protein [Irregularibacter muris]